MSTKPLTRTIAMLGFSALVAGCQTFVPRGFVKDSPEYLKQRDAAEHNERPKDTALADAIVGILRMVTHSDR